MADQAGLHGLFDQVGFTAGASLNEAPVNPPGMCGVFDWAGYCVGVPPVTTTYNPPGLCSPFDFVGYCVEAGTTSKKKHNFQLSHRDVFFVLEEQARRQREAKRLHQAIQLAFEKQAQKAWETIYEQNRKIWHSTYTVLLSEV